TRAAAARQGRAPGPRATIRSGSRRDRTPSARLKVGSWRYRSTSRRKIMSPMRVICRVVPAGAGGVAALLFVTAAEGEPAASNRDGDEEGGACLAAFKSAEAQEQSGHLVEAGRLFRACGAARCGSPLWQECAARNTRLGSYTPSVVPFAVDATGQPRV